MIDFNDEKQPLPTQIVLDSSILIYLVVTEPDKAERQVIFEAAKQFLKRLESATLSGKCSAVAPIHVIVECFHFITRKEVQKYAASNKQYINNKRVTSWEVVYKSDPELMAKLNIPDKLEHFLTLIKTSGINIIQPVDLITNVDTKLEAETVRYMRELRLQASNAHILAVADRLEVKNLASLDRDFLKVTEASFNLYTSSFLTITT